MHESDRYSGLIRPLANVRFNRSGLPSRPLPDNRETSHLVVKGYIPLITL